MELFWLNCPFDPDNSWRQGSTRDFVIRRTDDFWRKNSDTWYLVFYREEKHFTKSNFAKVLA